MRKLLLKNIKKYKNLHKGAPLFSTSIRAGFQNLIEDDIEKRISLDREFEIQSPSTFVFHISGDSMVNLGIYEGDLAVVKKTTDINDKDIVTGNSGYNAWWSKEYERREADDL